MPVERDADSIAEVRDLLLRSDYSTSGIARLGIDLGMGVRTRDVPLLLRALEPVEPLASLIRLFVLGQVVDGSSLEKSIGRAGSAALRRAGLTQVAGKAVAPNVRLTPWRGFVFAHDPDPDDDLWPEHVSGPTPAADTLIRLVTANGGDAVDIGAGCGLFAILLAATQSSIVATDLNPSALRLARLNSHLNEVAVEVREGSFFEPIRDRTFDLVVSNPPFVISPETELLFRHSALGRDEVSRDMVRSAAAQLREGGFAYLLVNWVQPPDQPWIDVLAGWLEGSGCDVVGLLHGVEDPLAYSARWTAREQQLRPERHGHTLDRWLAHYRQERIEAIGSGAIVLRRRTGRNWSHGLELSGDSASEAGPHVQAIFAGRDLLDRTEERGSGRDADLLRSAFRMREPHRLTQSLVARDGEYTADPATLALETGLALRLEVPNELVPVLLRLDGTQSGEDVAREVAAETGGDLDLLRASTAGFLRELLQRGLLEAAPGPTRGPVFR